MKVIWRIIQAEIMKQHRNTFHSRYMYFALLIWPIVIFINAYYDFKPFNLSDSMSEYFTSIESMVTFLITGFLAYNSFGALVQSAWLMSFERRNGTLEMVFLSPANRMAIIYGRALGALFQNIWMFLIFAVFVTVYVNGIPLVNLLYLPLVFLILILSAMIWGGLMNVIFMFSRDAGILFNVFDEPMALFSGVRVPAAVFPLWAKVISVIFPLTHTLVIVRSLLIRGSLIGSLPSIGYLIAVSIIMIALTRFMLHKAEKHGRETGNFSFY